MQKRNQVWADCLRALFQKHNLSLRGAEQRAKNVVTRSYLSEWLHGKVPQYGTAVAFLGYFPRDEAIQCLKAVGYPVPPDWDEPVSPAPDRLAKQIDEAATRDEKIDRAFEYVRKDPFVRVGSTAMSKYPREAKLSIIRMYERHTGRQVLPPEII